MIARSPAMVRVLRMADACAPSSVAVLLLGETGTGKDLIARRIHEKSGQPGAFVAAHLGAMPEGLVESELFGHERGAFTSADHARKGLMSAARGGTLFLDEVGDVPPMAQVKLLRALQDGLVRSVGADFERGVHFRLICATNKDLTAEIERGAFRADLYHRINGFSILVPPLRERLVDLVALCRAFAREFGITVPLAVRRAMRARRWPGNVRELRAMIERLAMIQRAGLAAEVTEGELYGAVSVLDSQVDDLRQVVMDHVRAALARNGGHKRRTAKALGVDPATLWRWLSAPEGWRMGRLMRQKSKAGGS